MMRVLLFFLLYETQILVRVLFHTRSGIWYVEYGWVICRKGSRGCVIVSNHDESKRTDVQSVRTEQVVWF